MLKIRLECRTKKNRGHLVSPPLTTSKGYQPKLTAKADNPYLDFDRSPSNDGPLTLIILDVTKTSSNNCLVLV